MTARAPDDVWLVGGIGQIPEKRALIEHWNGQRWSVVSGPQLADSFLSGALALAPDDVWVAGNTGHNASTSVLIEHWNGTNWSVVSPKAQGGFLYALASVHGKIWAVGAIGTIDAKLHQDVAGTLLEEC